ncbi:hypothetical protein ANACAC_00418 [Anaerostipes caccae L1-92]|uniref:Uncharacterized protein n=1 Tax=Anaerostipes caccae (strain DSM 14662 / CCUG 47493 / JCM 13470 / NCIMB 13811 / L1-92) TaxID=411490 RepID=B0MA44_ANACD|nr:hypothetical protein ANACAC_00418 [Anaerostipes caccae L1-92]
MIRRFHAEDKSRLFALLEREGEEWSSFAAISAAETMMGLVFTFMTSWWINLIAAKNLADC